MEGPVAKSPREFAARRYIPHSMLVGALVVVVPITAAPLLVGLFTSRRSPWFTAILALVIAICASRLGSALWSGLPGTRHIAFAELMPWSFVRLLLAERRLVEATGRLGFDRRGRRFQPTAVSIEEQKKLLRALNHAVESKDLYTLGHTRRVSRHSYSLAKKLRLPMHDMEKVRVAADVHDVGKTYVPDEILRKPGKLTDDEYSIMKKHSEVGAEIVACLGDEQLTSIVRAHHERWDGHGYPDGLAGTDIPLAARIIAVADTYDAITTTRSYRAKSSHNKAIRILREESGRQFDPRVVDAFVSERPHRVAGSAFIFQQSGRWFLSWFQSAGAGAVAQAAILGGAAVLGAATLAPYLPQMSASDVRDRALVEQASGVEDSSASDSDNGFGDEESVSDTGIEPTGLIDGGVGRRARDGGTSGSPGSVVPDPGAPGGGGGPSGGGRRPGGDRPGPAGGSNSGGGSGGGGSSDPGGGGIDLPDVPDLPDLPEVPLPELPLPELPDLPEVPLPDLPLPELPLPELPLPDLPLPELPDLPGLP